MHYTYVCVFENKYSKKYIHNKSYSLKVLLQFGRSPAVRIAFIMRNNIEVIEVALHNTCTIKFNISQTLKSMHLIAIVVGIKPMACILYASMICLCLDCSNIICIKDAARIPVVIQQTQQPQSCLSELLCFDRSPYWSRQVSRVSSVHHVQLDEPSRKQQQRQPAKHRERDTARGKCGPDQICI